MTFVPKNKVKPEVEIKKGNIKFLFKFKDKIYFIEGIAHGSTNEGAIFKLDIKNNNFIYKKILEFDDSPQAYAIYNSKILIATYENFYLVENFKKELVFKDTFWSALYPNSIAVVDERSVYLGIRSGIVKLNISKKELKFYKYSE